MAYLGNKPVNNFVSFAKQDITGNGGTSYSLDYPVTGANDIDLYINNVRQEPTEAYSCSGSTLTLTEAVSSSDDIYAIFRGRALQTAQHPSDSALEASQATISGNTGIGTSNAYVGGVTGNGSLNVLHSTAGQWVMQGRADVVGANGLFIRAGDSSSDTTALFTGRDEADVHMKIDGEGRKTFGHDTALTLGNDNSYFQVIGSGSNDSNITIARFQSSNYGPYLNIVKSRSGTKGSFSRVSNNDYVGGINWYADDGYDANTAVASIEAQMDGNTGSNDMPGRIMFRTTPDGSNATVERMRIDNQGRVTMPYQPVFSYLGTKTHDIATTGTQVMSASNVWSNNVIHALNRGSHFVSSTGRFTAPVAGTYYFQFQCTYNDFGSGYLYFYMNINGTTKSTMQADQQTPQSAIVNHMYCELSANDYVDVSWTNNYTSGNIQRPGFSGMLVG